MNEITYQEKLEALVEIIIQYAGHPIGQLAVSEDCGEYLEGEEWERFIHTGPHWKAYVGGSDLGSHDADCVGRGPSPQEAVLDLISKWMQHKKGNQV